MCRKQRAECGCIARLHGMGREVISLPSTPVAHVDDERQYAARTETSSSNDMRFAGTIAPVNGWPQNRE